MGGIHVPDRDARQADVKDRVTRKRAELRSLRDIILLHIDYTVELLADTDCPRLNTEMWKAAFDKCLGHRRNDIMSDVPR